MSMKKSLTRAAAYREFVDAMSKDEREIHEEFSSRVDTSQNFHSFSDESEPFPWKVGDWVNPSAKVAKIEKSKGSGIFTEFTYTFEPVPIG